MQCAKRDELSAKAAHVLGVIVKLGNEQIDCLKSNDQKRLLEIDKELESQYETIDLELGFTFAGVAKTELEMRDVEGFNQAKGKALKVVRMVEHLRGRLPEESKTEINERLSKLKILISTL